MLLTPYINDKHAVFFDAFKDVHDGEYPYDDRDYLCYANATNRTSVVFVMSYDTDLHDYGPDIAEQGYDRLYSKEQIHAALVHLLTEYDHDAVTEDVYILTPDNKATLVSSLFPELIPEPLD